MRNALFKHRVGRIHYATVDIPRHFEIKKIRTMLGIIKVVAGSLVHGHGHRMGLRIAGKTTMNGNCFPFHKSLPQIELSPRRHTRKKAAKRQPEKEPLFNRGFVPEIKLFGYIRQ